jgi:hypothetical protein
MLQYLSDLPRQAVHCKWLREQFDARVQDTIMNDRVLGVVTDEQDLDAGMAAAVMKTILSHANLIDCVEPNVQPDTAVLIEDGRIRAILPSGEAGSAGDAQVIDLKGGYLMPGLWDVHIHPDYLSLEEMPLAANKLGSQCWHPIITALPVVFDHHVLSVDVAGFAEPLAESMSRLPYSQQISRSRHSRIRLSAP